MKKCLVPILMLCAANAHANTNVDILSESKVGIAYQNLKSDEMDIDLSLTGMSINAGYQFDNRVYIKAVYATLSDDIDVFGTMIDTDLDAYSLGLGRQFKLSKHSLWYGELGLLGAESTARVPNSTETVTLSDDEPYLALGYKYRASKNTVLEGQVNYVDGTVAGLAAAQYNFNRHFAMNASVEFDGDATSLLLGVSYFY